MLQSDKDVTNRSDHLIIHIRVLHHKGQKVHMRNHKVNANRAGQTGKDDGDAEPSQ